ncbi:inositol-3-phosphate synthase [Methylobacterium nonmethylotrophicum]|uniref:Inositol-3-phosphate synthase n=1 Tax=Methylobacterium nonmethylotrophicum TaxID=1141884 RepID=A0A4Z0NS06_9HYPH|nr:inositol-3-phosphate synthase [Methylobacterium nonmethylotrophicum]TGD99056.1 inositol-3-phosphate synthase [Methylobacterium nonmethylotrophicum]
MGQKSVRVAIAGVGNCACSFVQGLTYYREAGPGDAVPGLMSPDLGGYRVADVTVVAAFDVAKAKVGRDLAEAIGAPPNNTARFADVAPTGVMVERGPTLDGLGRYLEAIVPESPARPVDVAASLRRTGAEVLVSYLPVGSQGATEYYAEAALAAGCAFVNCIPVFIASHPEWRQRFEAAGLPLIGDDIKSQVGATIVHRALAHLFRERGVKLERTYQLNFGGNADFRNMLERERLESKKISKTQSVQSQLETALPADDIHVGPSDYVPWLSDRKWAHIRLEGTAFGGVPLNLELKLEVWDSPNSAGIVIDAVRCAALARERRIGGALIGPSSWLMKSPPEQFTDEEAHRRTLAFVAGA